MSTQFNFITEASREVGIGHFMRCFALAEEAVKRKVKSHFILTQTSSQLLDRLDSIGVTYEVAGADPLAACIEVPKREITWWIVDSYQLPYTLYTALKNFGNVMVIDDLCHHDSYPCDIILNSSASAWGLGYKSKAPHARLLLGSSYSLVRAEFRSFSSRVRTAGFTKLIAILMGGSDTKGITRPLLEALHRSLTGYEFLIILGAAVAEKDEIIALASTLSGASVQIQPPNLAELLSSTVLVITAAGGSIGELCALGVMAVALVVVDNQVGALSACPFPCFDCRKGPPPNLGPLISEILKCPSRNAKIVAKAREVVDGKGCERVMDEMLNI